MTGGTGFELSLQQRTAWRRHASGDAAPADLAVGVLIDLAESPDPASLEEGLAAATVRYEFLRTSFSQAAGRRFPVQIIADEAQPPTLDDRAAGLDHDPHRIAREIIDEGFDLERGPLLKAALVTRANGCATLALVASDLILDIDSLRLLAFEILGSRTDDEPLQYGDYAAWQAEILEAQPPRPDHANQAVSSGLLLGVSDEHHRVDIVLPPLSDGPGVDEGDAWLTAWAVLIARLTGRDDVTVAVVPRTRASEELDSALGVYARRVPVTLDMSDNPSFRAVAATVAARRRAAELDQEAAETQQPVVGFVLEDPIPAPDALPILAVHDIEAPESLEADLHVTVNAANVHVSLHTTGLDEHRTRSITRSLRTLASHAASAPDTPVRDLEILAPADLDRLRELGWGPSLAVGAPVHERFAAAAARTPDAPAVSSGEARLTYAQLEARANAIAAAVSARVERGAVVALLLDRGPDAIAAILGVMKAGSPYLPLNPDQPTPRLAFQVSDAQTALVLTDEAHSQTATELQAGVLEMTDAVASQSPPASTAVVPEDLAYVIYTSGSTGVPKGVEVTHANLANYVDAISEVLRLGDARVPLSFGVVTSLSTDLGNTGVFPALASGGCVELIPTGIGMDGAAYVGYAAEHRVDILKITPSHLGALISSGDAGVLPHHCLVLGGEAASWSLVDAVRDLGDCRILNHYGPTETTVGSVTSEVSGRHGAHAVATTVPIGRPLRNTSVTVVDERLAPVPMGTPGELLIGGAGVARGYRGQPEQTAERFVADPFSAEGSRAYRTGDQVRMLSDGQLEFLHRADGQFKIRGYRVETAEIESVLRSQSSVGQVAVVPREHAPGDVRLVAYVVPAPDCEVDSSALRSAAEQTLPDYMVPSSFVSVAAFPRLPSGKLDVTALPAPDEVKTANEYVAPSTETERRIVEIWATALGVQRVGVTDDFFELGGHSLLATQVIARIRAAFDIQLPLHSLFTAPRVQELAVEVDQRRTHEQAELTTLLSELEGLSDEDAERMLGAE